MLPVIELQDERPVRDIPVDINEQQIGRSSLYNYLGINAIGVPNDITKHNVKRKFNAIPILAYYDIFKNYYSNKQEKMAYIINTRSLDWVPSDLSCTAWSYPDGTVNGEKSNITEGVLFDFGDTEIYRKVVLNNNNIDPHEIYISGTLHEMGRSQSILKTSALSLLPRVTVEPQEIILWLDGYWDNLKIYVHKGSKGTQLIPFELKDIDDMRELILTKKGDEQFIINYTNILLYNLSNVVVEQKWGGNPNKSRRGRNFPLDGLVVKTYQSDIFNNWLETETIVGENSITELTKIDTSQGYFTIDTLNIAKKVNMLLNRVMVSGGTYKDWVESVYSVDSFFNNEIPQYEGGAFSEIVFTEVTNTGSEENKPLGSIVGKGISESEQKGGKIVVRVNEPCYIIGICSITPRIDYSQGNRWDVNLKTLDDLHKPQLDGIGFQDLLTDQMAAITTEIDEEGNPIYKSVGKQPAWINYMTNYNRLYGSFGEVGSQMFMTLNRRYEINKDWNIKDLTTYIDPKKFNYIFAESSRDALNFWTQIQVDINARRVMSAKQIPNL